MEENNQSVVWVTSRGTHDYEPLKRFGKINFLKFEGLTHNLKLNRYYMMIDKQLSAKATADDWLVLAGLPTINYMVVAWWARKFGKLNLLIYRSNSHDYVQRRLVF